MIPKEDIKIDIGRITGGSFIRVNHLPTGRSRMQGPLGGQLPENVQKRLLEELEAELRKAGLTQYLID